MVAIVVALDRIGIRICARLATAHHNIATTVASGGPYAKATSVGTVKLAWVNHIKAVLSLTKNTMRVAGGMSRQIMPGLSHELLKRVRMKCVRSGASTIAGDS